MRLATMRNAFIGYPQPGAGTWLSGESATISNRIGTDPRLGWVIARFKPLSCPLKIVPVV